MTTDFLFSSWAPAGRGKGALTPWKCYKVFCALVVTAKMSVLRVSTKKGRHPFLLPEFDPWKKSRGCP